MWKFKGLPLTRQQMSKWLIDVFNNQLSSLYDLLLKELKRQRFLHVDETSYNTLASEKAKTYYWVVASGKIDEVFELERKLSAKFNDDECLNYRRKTSSCSQASIFQDSFSYSIFQVSIGKSQKLRLGSRKEYSEHL